MPLGAYAPSLQAMERPQVLLPLVVPMRALPAPSPFILPAFDRATSTALSSNNRPPHDQAVVQPFKRRQSTKAVEIEAPIVEPSHVPLELDAQNLPAELTISSAPSLSKQAKNRENHPLLAAFYDGVCATHAAVNTPIQDFKKSTNASFDKKIELLNHQAANDDVSAPKRALLLAEGAVLEAAKTVADAFLPSHVEEAAGNMIGAAAGAVAAVKTVAKANETLQLYAQTRRTRRSLAVNPFKDKTFEQIDARLRQRGFLAKGESPETGVGSYMHKGSGRKYFLDKGKQYSKGYEYPHVDVHRMNKTTGEVMERFQDIPKTSSFTKPKRKYPLGDKVHD